MTTPQIETGKQGERIATDYLKKNGYTIIVRNYTNRFGEIDIIAQDGEAIVFLEVKTKKESIAFGPPQIAVTRSKQKKIIKTSLIYIKQNHMNTLSFRFDVIAITLLSDGNIKKDGITLIKNAFQADGY